MPRKPSSNTATHFESFLQAAAAPDYDHHTKIIAVVPANNEKDHLAGELTGPLLTMDIIQRS